MTCSFADILSTYSEVLTASEPRSCAIGGLFRAGVMTRANSEHAVVVSRVTAKEGVGKGGLSSSCGSNYDDPWVGKIWDKGPLALGQRNDSQEEKCCLHGDETETTAQDLAHKLFVQVGPG